ncbi:hypothetical protein F4679DRAFT_566579 [Xylaria curta]|nr:hypothetical protein F4679DRAFT_566579 [Xylaria curta]
MCLMPEGILHLPSTLKTSAILVIRVFSIKNLMASPPSHRETTASLLSRVKSHQLYRPPPRKCADQKCDKCRQKKLKCVPEGSGCEQCSKAKLLCPGLTRRKRSCRTPVDPPATSSFSSTPRQSGTPGDRHQDESVSLGPSCAVQNSCSHQLPKTFRLHQTGSGGTSWSHNILTDRSSLPVELAQKSQCDLCSEQIMPRAVFEVLVTRFELIISTKSHSLHQSLEEALGERLGGVEKAFDGKVLLRHYATLKAYFDNLRLFLPIISDRNIIEEWTLLLEGFLANRSAFRCFDFWHPDNSCLLNDELHEAFTQQELELGISALHQAYIEADRYQSLVMWRKYLGGQPGCGKSIIMSPVPRDEDIKMCKEEQLRRFHSSFNKQYKRLKRAAREHRTILDPLSWQSQNSRQAWNAAITAMRQLSKLESSPKLLDALCFLCASRAVAETAQHERDAYMSAFSQDLNKWSEILPGVKEVSMLMWEIDLNSIPQLEPRFSTEMERLRLSVAALLIKTNEMFGCGHNSSHEKTHEPGVSYRRWPTNIKQAPQAMESPGPQSTARQKEPPDRIPHEEKTPSSFTDVVTLVTSIIFALVVHFMLGFVYVSSIAIMGFSNPWQNPTSQADTRIHTPSYPATNLIESRNTFSNIPLIPPSRDHPQEPTMCPFDNDQTPNNEYYHHNQAPLASSSTGDTIRTLDYNSGSSLDPRVLDNTFRGPLSLWSWDVIATEGDEDGCHSSNRW